jgi:hypothetical protein
MTPKEKAKELVNNFCNIDLDAEMFDDFKMPIFYAQRCALIAVDEILTYQEQLLQNYKVKLENSYWYKVQQEIGKL